MFGDTGDDLIDFNLYVFHETPKAWLVGETADEKKAVWIPKSRCKYDNPVRKGKRLTADFSVPEWICREKGLI